MSDPSIDALDASRRVGWARAMQAEEKLAAIRKRAPLPRWHIHLESGVDPAAGACLDVSPPSRLAGGRPAQHRGRRSRLYPRRRRGGRDRALGARASPLDGRGAAPCWRPPRGRRVRSRARPRTRRRYGVIPDRWRALGALEQANLEREAGRRTTAWRDARWRELVLELGVPLLPDTAPAIADLAEELEAIRRMPRRWITGLSL